MPVLVTNAGTAVGRLVARALLHRGGEVRAYADPAADGTAPDELRRMGCKVARGTLDDEAHLELALEQVHTVVHLARGPLAAPDDEVDEAASVLSAAIGARCRRVVFPSFLGAEAPDGNAYLQACADVEALLADAPLESVVVRRALPYGPGEGLSAVLAQGVPPGTEDARHAPLLAHDLADVIAQADAQRGGAGDLHVVVALAGPEETTLAELGRLLASVRTRLPEPPCAPAELPAWTRDLLARDLVRADGVLGAQGTALVDGVRRILES